MCHQLFMSEHLLRSIHKLLFMRKLCISSEHLFVGTACVEDTKMCASVCVCVCPHKEGRVSTHIWVKGCVGFTNHLCVHSSARFQLPCILSVGKQAPAHKVTHSPSINSAWRAALPPSFVSISGLPRAVIAFASPSPGTPASLNYKIIQGQLIPL